MESLVTWFAATLGPYISEKAVVFLISMMPLLELRGGLLASSLLKVSAVQAIPICIIGNILPIPFILLFIKKIFQWMKKIKCFRGMIEKLENRAMGRSEKIQQYEFWGLVLFVGIPLPGTGAWTGALIASRFNGSYPQLGAFLYNVLHLVALGHSLKKRNPDIWLAVIRLLIADL